MVIMYNYCYREATQTSFWFPPGRMPQYTYLKG